MKRRISMFRAIDLWIGRHMGAKRWIVAWALLFTLEIMLMVKYGGWVIAIGTPVACVALLGAFGNAKRLRCASSKRCGSLTRLFVSLRSYGSRRD